MKENRQPLSDLQRVIIEKAREQQFACYSDVLQEYYGLSPRHSSRNNLTFSDHQDLKRDIRSARVSICKSFNRLVDRAVSGSTASNLNWVLNGVDTTTSVTALHSLFDTADTQNKIGVDQNLHNEGDWSLDVTLNVLAGNNIDMGLVNLDAFIFNNYGALQSQERDLDLNFSLFDSNNNSLDSVDSLDVYNNVMIDGIPQPRNVSFDFSGNTLFAGEIYHLTLTASGTGIGIRFRFDANSEYCLPHPFNLDIKIMICGKKLFASYITGGQANGGRTRYLGPI